MADDVPRERYANLDFSAPFGAWFDALLTRMSDGNPPVRRCLAGEQLIRSGEPAEKFFVLLEGNAAVEGVFEANELLTVGPGSLLGELGLLFERRRRRNIVALTPLTVIEGTREELEASLLVDEIGEHVANVAAHRLAEAVRPVAGATHQGRPVVLRPLLASDRALYRESLGSISLETLRRRFFTPRPPADAVVERLIHIDHVDHVAWICLTPEGRVLGFLRFVVQGDEPGVADIAITVGEESQRHRGVGTLMVGVLGVLAEARGVKTFRGEVLADNTPMRGLMSKLGARWTRLEPDVLEARLPVAGLAELLDGELRASLEQAARRLTEVALLADA